jgi:hypothetical protein
VRLTQTSGKQIARIAYEIGISGSRAHQGRKELAGTDSALSLKALNTAVQENAVQQPVQQRRRTSAHKNNTLRTVKSHFKHRTDKGEHQRTMHVESPFGMPSFYFEPHQNSSKATSGLRCFHRSL